MHPVKALSLSFFVFRGNQPIFLCYFHSDKTNIFSSTFFHLCKGDKGLLVATIYGFIPPFEGTLCS